jgi:aryl-alcohol dehydrogenase-like predicted oxidoreductase
LPALGEGQDASAVASHCRASLEALGVDRVDGYLLHRASDMRQPGVVHALRELVASRRVGAFGISAYRPEQIEDALRIDDLSLLQCPISLFDQRAIKAGLLEQCHQRRIVVFARSIFLQGSLLMDPERLPHFLSELARPLKALREIAHVSGRSVTELALLAVRDLPGISSIVIGAESADQVREWIRVLDAPPLSASLREELWGLGRGIPERLVDISAWPKTAG